MARREDGYATKMSTMREQLVIGGEWVDGSENSRIDVFNPANGEKIASVADGTPADATAAVEAASTAQVEWAKVAPRQRGEILRACWQTLLDHSDELAELITLEHGKPLADAKGEVAYSAEFFRWNSEEAVRIHGSISVAPSGNNKIMVRHPPVGVVTMVTPWNFPAAMIARKLAPALAAGNAAVVKPAAETPLTALRSPICVSKQVCQPGLSTSSRPPTRESGSMQRSITRPLAWCLSRGQPPWVGCS